MIARSTESLIDELVEILDAEAELLELKRLQLADLAEVLVAVDDEAVEELLEQIERAGRTQTAVDLKFKAVRAALAEAFGYENAGALKLSVLVAELPEAQASVVDDRRRRIADLVGNLRKQHLQTAMLLVECSRVNRMMMECILPSGETVATYDAAGTNLWQSGTSLVNKEL